MMETEKREVVIDLSRIASKESFHRILQIHLDLPEYYGSNLDALHDCLTEAPGARLVFINAGDLRPGMKRYFSSVKKMLEDIEDQKEGFEYAWSE